MKHTRTTLYQVYGLLLETKELCFYLGEVEMTPLYSEVRKEGDSSLCFAVELVELGTNNDGEYWQSGFGNTWVIVESDRRDEYATIVLAPLSQKQFPLMIKIERRLLPRKFR